MDYYITRFWESRGIIKSSNVASKYVIGELFVVKGFRTTFKLGVDIFADEQLARHDVEERRQKALAYARNLLNRLENYSVKIKKEK